MARSKGGSQTQRVEIPAWMEDVAKRNLARAEAMSKVGYQPFYGTDVVGFGPTGDLARQANIDAAIAYGMAPEGTKATPIGDMSSGTLYDQAVAEAARRNPGQEAYYNHFFIDPVTGAMPGYEQAIIDRATPGQPNNPRNPNFRSPGDPYDPGMNSPEVGVVNPNNPIFTNEEFLNLAAHALPGYTTLKTVGDFVKSFTGDDNSDEGSSSGTSGSTQSTNSGFSSSNWSR
jgi:hypothetical protein